MTPEEMEALVLAALARERAHRWGYDASLGGDVVEFIAQQVTDLNTVADIRTVMATLNDAGLLVTDAKAKVLRTANEWRDASLFTGEVAMTFGERLTRLDEATPALQQAVDELRAAATPAVVQEEN